MQVMGRLGLVIDDDVPSRKIYATLLQSMGFDAQEAGDGVQAMSILREQQPELIFLDIRLPQVDGLKILEYIYASAHLNRSRVVIITAHKDYENHLRLRSGDLYLLKPIPPSEIREIVAESLTP